MTQDELHLLWATGGLANLLAFIKSLEVLL